jgi:hypothetical protein
MSYFSCRSSACLRKGNIPIFSYLLVGVSKTSDPRDGFLGPYFIATDGIDPNTNEVTYPPPPFPPISTPPILHTLFPKFLCLGLVPCTESTNVHAVQRRKNTN